MDWALAIERNRVPLIGIVAALFALAGISPEANLRPLRLPKHLRYAILRILRPAEAAARRLIVIAARNLKPSVSKTTASMTDFARFQQAGAQSPAFRLIDTRKRFFRSSGRRFAKITPRISVPGITPVDFALEITSTAKDNTVNATPLLKRLVALKTVLDNLPKQANRMARYEARVRDRSSRRIRLSPLRPGFPPGHRKRKKHEVDHLLMECDLLAREALKLVPY